MVSFLCSGDSRSKAPWFNYCYTKLDNEAAYTSVLIATTHIKNLGQALNECLDYEIFRNGWQTSSIYTTMICKYGFPEAWQTEIITKYSCCFPWFLSVITWSILIQIAWFACSPGVINIVIWSQIGYIPCFVMSHDEN